IFSIWIGFVLLLALTGRFHENLPLFRRNVHFVVRVGTVSSTVVRRVRVLVTFIRLLLVNAASFSDRLVAVRRVVTAFLRLILRLRIGIIGILERALPFVRLVCSIAAIITGSTRIGVVTFV